MGVCKPEDLGEGSWSEVVGKRKLYAAIHVEFGLAEEVIGFLEFEDGTFEVGIGECLRPYDLRYAGKEREKASQAFIEAIDSCATI